MSYNFFPKNVFKGTNADGSKFTVREYDFETYANLELAHFFVMLLGGAVLGVFLAPLFLILSLFSFGGSFNLRYLLTGLISAYVLFDAYNGWLMLRLLDLVFEESTISTLIAINTGVLVVSLVLFLFGGFIYGLVCGISESVSGRWMVFLFGCLFIFMFGYSRGKSAVNNTGWVATHLETKGSQENESQENYERYQHMSNDQIKEEAERDYEEQLRSEGRDPNDMKQYEN